MNKLFYKDKIKKDRDKIIVKAPIIINEKDINFTKVCVNIAVTLILATLIYTLITSIIKIVILMAN